MSNFQSSRFYKALIIYQSGSRLVSDWRDELVCLDHCLPPPSTHLFKAGQNYGIFGYISCWKKIMFRKSISNVNIVIINDSRTFIHLS